LESGLRYALLYSEIVQPYEDRRQKGLAPLEVFR